MFKDLFDDYFISASLGVTKSNPKFFELIIAALSQRLPGLAASNIIFFDDSQSKVDAARAAGINAQLYTDISQVKALLRG